MKIAFLGLGNMGSHMARNLVDAGYSVTGFDVVEAALQAATEHGVMPGILPTKRSKTLMWLSPCFLPASMSWLLIVMGYWLQLHRVRCLSIHRPSPSMMQSKQQKWRMMPGILH